MYRGVCLCDNDLGSRNVGRERGKEGALPDQTLAGRKEDRCNDA